MEAEKQLSDANVNKEVNFDGKLIQDLTEISNKIFRSLKKRGVITDKELKYFSFDRNLRKLCICPKIHEKHFNVPGRLVISNCKTLTEKSL